MHSCMMKRKILMMRTRLLFPVCLFPPKMLGFLVVLLALTWGTTGEAAKIVFNHTPPASVPPGVPLTIRGEIPENDDLEEVYFHYRQIGRKGYIRATMSLYKGFRYKVTLPAGRVYVPGFQYYVSGVDLNRKKYFLFASPTKPATMKVVKPKKKPKNTTQKAEPKKPKTDDGDSTPQRGEERIVSASRKEQRIQKAPGVITVITAEDIKAEGWRDVVSLLRYATGIDINQNGLGSIDIGIRGVNPRLAFGDKLVLLIDGHNMSWRQLNRNSTFISIDMIKRIEIIRGPGSALWGANALSGVINIITKTTQDLKGVSATIGGSPISGSYFLTLQGGRELVSGLTFRASFSLYQNNRSPILAPIREFLNLQGTQPIEYSTPGDQEYNQYFYAQLAWRGLSLTFYQTRFEGFGPLSTYSLVGGDDTRFASNRYIARLSWIGTLGDWGVMVLWGAYDYFGFARGSVYEANATVPQPSASQLDGNSGYFQLYDKTSTGGAQFKGIYPVCQLVPQTSTTPCIQLEPISGPRTCILTNGPTDTDRSKTYPIPLQCRPTYQGGRFTRPFKGSDHRVEGGAQLSAQVLNNLYLLGGIDFEYLNLNQVHFPDIWEFLGLQEPFFTNFHFSAFVQAQYNLLNLFEFTASGRIDYDQRYGLVATPRLAVVITPGLGFYGKVLYGNAFKAPSFIDYYYYRKNESYGNPELRPESVHTVEVQLGWYRKRLMAISVNGYFSVFDNLITFVRRNDGGELTGYKGENAKFIPDAQRPDPGVPFDEKQNSASLITYGGEFELRLFPVKGLNIFANFGLYLGQDSQNRPLEYAASWSASIRASYRYKFFQIAAGALVVGPKLVPAGAFAVPGGYLPAQDTNFDRPVPVPSWSAANDPTTETPLYVHTFASVQFRDILKHLDIIIRVNNFINANMYDASDLLLMPQKKLELMGWIRLHY